MHKIKVLLDFVIFSANDKVTTFTSILNHMTANPLYTQPDVPLAEAKLELDKFILAISAAQDHSRTAVSLMHDCDKSCTLIFRNLAAYVNRIANGDASKILSSGFTPSGPYSPREKAVLTVTDGIRSGTAKGAHKLVPKTGAYIWEINTGTGGWRQVAVTTQTTYLFEGLTVGTEVQIKAAAVTIDGMLDFCAPVTKLIN